MSYSNDMIVYLYYVKEKYEPLYGEMYPIFNNIFAYTEKKECAKLFEFQRNMKMFKREKKEMTKSEYNSFLRYMNDNSDRYLTIYPYNFYSSQTEEARKTDMAVTIAEQKRIDGRMMMLELNITKYCWYSPNIFNSDIKKALKILKYNNISKFIGTYPNKVFKSKSYSIDDPEDSNSLEDIIKINELDLVIDVIGGTLKV